MLPFVSVGALSFVAATLLVTGVGHATRPGGFARLLRHHGLVPAAWTTPVALSVAGGELLGGGAALAALLFADPRPGRAAFAWSLAAGITFFLYLRRLLRAGHTGSCGCSPLASPLTPASLVPSAALAVAGALGLLAQSVGGGSVSATFGAGGALGIAWGVTLTGLVLLLPATAPGAVILSRGAGDPRREARS